MVNKVTVIGSGFAGLSAACFMAQAGLQVTVLEKNEQPGGRARSFSASGFTYDMGPSWYWMPDVFERFFNSFGTSHKEFYTLKRLDPSYQVIWADETVPVPADYGELRQLFEQLEPGAGARLDAFLKEAAYKYDAGINNLVYKPGLSLTEFMRRDVLSAVFKIDILSSIHRHVRKYFSNPKLLQLAEFPVLFLGALPENTPALYSLMNYADMKLGTWYPEGGMVRIVEGMYTLAQRLGVEFRFNEPVENIVAAGSEVLSVETSRASYRQDVVVAACDYHHTDRQLLDNSHSNYGEAYWNSRKMAPSCLLYYVGINKRLEKMEHHNLFFDAPFDRHAAALYTDPAWPEEPLMYVCCPSKTDATVAPDGCENVFILIPVAPGLEDTEEIREHYFDLAIRRIEQRTGQQVRDAVIYKRSYAGSNFISDYHAFKGNAYGLANTLKQTAVLKPGIRNKKLHNLFYTGQLTVPGPGVPPAIISGEVVAGQVQQLLKLKTYKP